MFQLIFVLADGEIQFTVLFPFGDALGDHDLGQRLVLLVLCSFGVFDVVDIVDEHIGIHCHHVVSCKLLSCFVIVVLLDMDVVPPRVFLGVMVPVLGLFLDLYVLDRYGLGERLGVTNHCLFCN